MIRGYEKAWNALLTGSAVASVSVLARWLFGLTDVIPDPSPEDIVGAIDGFIVALAAAAGAYLATTTPTSHPDDATPNPRPSVLLTEEMEVRQPAVTTTVLRPTPTQEGA